MLRPAEMDLTRQFVTSYPVIRRAAPPFPVVGGGLVAGPGLPASAVTTPRAGAPSPGEASSSPADRRRASRASPRAPVACPQTTHHVLPESTPMPLCAGLFSPAAAPQLSKHLNFA